MEPLDDKTYDKLSNISDEMLKMAYPRVPPLKTTVNVVNTIDPMLLGKDVAEIIQDLNIKVTV